MKTAEELLLYLLFASLFRASIEHHPSLQRDKTRYSRDKYCKCILETFIPHSLLHSLRTDFVNRPQNIEEPKRLCISGTRENAEIVNLNPETHSKLNCCGNSRSYNDLDRICIQYNNVNYLNFTTET